LRSKKALPSQKLKAVRGPERQAVDVAPDLSKTAATGGTLSSSVDSNPGQYQVENSFAPGPAGKSLNVPQELVPSVLPLRISPGVLFPKNYSLESPDGKPWILPQVNAPKKSSAGSEELFEPPLHLKTMYENHDEQVLRSQEAEAGQKLQETTGSENLSSKIPGGEQPSSGQEDKSAEEASSIKAERHKFDPQQTQYHPDAGLKEGGHGYLLTNGPGFVVVCVTALGSVLLLVVASFSRTAVKTRRRKRGCLAELAGVLWDWAATFGPACAIACAEARGQCEGCESWWASIRPLAELRRFHCTLMAFNRSVFEAALCLGRGALGYPSLEDEAAANSLVPSQGGGPRNINYESTGEPGELVASPMPSPCDSGFTGDFSGSEAAEEGESGEEGGYSSI